VNVGERPTKKLRTDRAPSIGNRGGAQARADAASELFADSLLKPCGNKTSGVNVLNCPKGACDGNCRHRMNRAFETAEAYRVAVEDCRLGRVQMANDERLDHLRILTGGVKPEPSGQYSCFGIWCCLSHLMWVHGGSISINQELYGCFPHIFSHLPFLVELNLLTLGTD
jgi:hypothetical protein